MPRKNYFKKNGALGIFLLASLLLLGSCHSYEYVSYNDGIYGEVESQKNFDPKRTNLVSQKPNQYASYFSNKALEYDDLDEQGVVFTDIDSYSNENYTDTNPSTLNYESGNPSWGSVSDKVEVNIYNTGFRNPFWGGYYSYGWDNYYGYYETYWNYDRITPFWNGGFYCPPYYNYGYYRQPYYRTNRYTAYNRGYRNSYLNRNTRYRNSYKNRSYNTNYRSRSRSFVNSNAPRANTRSRSNYNNSSYSTRSRSSSPNTTTRSRSNYNNESYSTGSRSISPNTNTRSRSNNNSYSTRSRSASPNTTRSRSNYENSSYSTRSRNSSPNTTTRSRTNSGGSNSSGNRSRSRRND